jgi:acyl carrier protein
VERVGVNDNFFELGGHSLLVVTIHSRLRRELGVTFPLAQLFQFPTVSSLAQYLSQDSEFRTNQAEALRNRAQLQRENLARRQRVVRVPR